jgi:NAD(P) transhydrogenase subunit alpha
MPLTIGVLTSPDPLETRVAATPDSIRKWIANKHAVIIPAGAGQGVQISDALFSSAGASVAPDIEIVLSNSDICVGFSPPPLNTLRGMKPGSILICLADPYRSPDLIQVCKDQNITLMALELVPRITRAQSMDVLSSQSNLGGYRAVIEAAAHFPRAFPMMMTAAGTIPPAKVFVMGAGVAGLQAIATAKRLGAAVSATDVRRAAGEQIASLGAKFIMADDDADNTDAETSAGYAREMSAAFQERQAALIASVIAQQDIVITTAQIPGRPAPRLVTADMIKTMKPGSIVIDMATSSGGNIEGSVKDDIVQTKNRVLIIGFSNMPARIPVDASSLFARNITALLDLIIPKDQTKPVINLDDDIIKSMTITHNGQIVHPGFTPA